MRHMCCCLVKLFSLSFRLMQFSTKISNLVEKQGRSLQTAALRDAFLLVVIHLELVGHRTTLHVIALKVSRSYSLHLNTQLTPSPIPGPASTPSPLPTTSFPKPRMTYDDQQINKRPSQTSNTGTKLSIEFGEPYWFRAAATANSLYFRSQSRMAAETRHFGLC